MKIISISRAHPTPFFGVNDVDEEEGDNDDSHRQTTEVQKNQSDQQTVQEASHADLTVTPERSMRLAVTGLPSAASR